MSDNHGILEAFARFDDHMEAREPGYKARKAQERAERERQWAEYRIAVLEKYGSEDVARAPTPIERAIEAAVDPLRRSVRVGTHAVESLDGWHDLLSAREAPDSVRRAVEQAWQMPTTILAAKAEYDRWEERDDELNAAWGAARGEYIYLPLACSLRHDIIRLLLETGLRAQSIAEVLIRQRHYIEREFSIPEIEQAVLADLERLATLPPPLSAADPCRRY
jgi:hypothetical protein